MQPISVSILNEQIKQLMESTFLQVAVEGEVSRPTYHGSGHVYFSIKDENSQIKAVMFRGNAVKLKFRLEDGMKVVLFGAVTVYKPRGEYQLNVSHIEPAGVGNLALAFKQLKEKLSQAGFFNPEHKKPKPKTIEHMVLITSATGAALQDMLRLVSKRWPMIKLTLIDVLVQGDRASSEIANAIRHADTLGADAIVISRGGGSVEDLWAFNEESVATALYHAQTFCVSAVGHEIDWVISDYVADMRAATPTAAMELLLPDQWEMQQYLDQLRDQFDQRMRTLTAHAHTQLESLKERLARYSIENKFKSYFQEIETLKGRFDQYFKQRLIQKEQTLFQDKMNAERSMQMKLSQKEQQLQALFNALSQADPKHKDKKGFVELSKEGRRADIADVAVGDEITLSSSAFTLQASVLSKKSL